ncbi:nuclear transport factor 2 family protein [Pseudonocardia sp. ICBG1293]|uniref:nuclear transport factor 2 family protein n=1 Tax=Pseudonocardia sp. ICBG1293 TaxID=2844382 RepID=UPI001CCD719B|nr:nuclear transport factor 2 family protein [Pseudonocardia sp. ICBG1293]
MTAEDDIAGRRAGAPHAVVEHLRLTAAGRVDECVELFAPDAVPEFPFAPVGVSPRVTGRDALIARMSRFPEPFDVEFVDLVFHETVDPSLVVAEFRSTSTARPTGEPYEQTLTSRSSGPMTTPASSTTWTTGTPWWRSRRSHRTTCRPAPTSACLSAAESGRV